MNVYQMRDLVEQAYPGQEWKKKVEKMTDEQIVALYLKLLRQGKIN